VIGMRLDLNAQPNTHNSWIAKTMADMVEILHSQCCRKTITESLQSLISTLSPRDLLISVKPDIEKHILANKVERDGK
jgi:hypothetical protein